MCNSINRKSQRGFTLLEMIVALIVLCSLIGLGAIYMKNNADRVQNESSAANLRQITDVVKNYARDNYNTIYEKVDTGLIYQIELNGESDELVINNYLSQNSPIVNSYGQRHLVNITKEADNLMSIIVLTFGGEKMEEGAMMQTAAMVGGDGGYISLLDNSLITGSQKGWYVPLIAEAVEGHLATVNYLSEKDIINAGEFLRRKKVDGHDEWNEMETTLAMNGEKIAFTSGVIEFNNEDNVASITSDTISLSQGDKDKNGEYQTKTVVTPGGIELRDLSSINARDLNHSRLNAEWLKPGVTIISDSSVSGIYTAADNICDTDADGNIGKIFVIGTQLKDERIMFMCGRNDGSSYASGGGRAYIVMITPEPFEEGINNSCKTYQYWIPSNVGSDVPKDNPYGCLIRKFGARSGEYSYLRYDRTYETSYYYNKTSLALRCGKPLFGGTQRTNICYVATKIVTFDLDGSMPEVKNDAQCNSESRGRANNIYLEQNIGELSNTQNPCKQVKFHAKGGL